MRSTMITRAYGLLDSDPVVLAEQQRRARFILVDEFQDANFAQVKILSLLATGDRNVFAVGDPDQAIYRFRGASSAAFELFQRNFPNPRLVVLGKNQRSTSPILRAAFSVIDKNPNILAHGYGNGSSSTLAYGRQGLVSAREERAAAEGRPFSSAKVEVIALTGRDMESADLVSMIQERRRQLRCRWSDFAILYRTHLHRDEVARELGEQDIPFTIENLDVMDTPEVRDFLACLGAVHSPLDASSYVRVAALPQFDIDPQQFRSALRAAAGPNGSGASLEAMLASVPGGNSLIDTLRQTREEIGARTAKVRQAMDIVARKFRLETRIATVRSLLDFAATWEHKPLTETGQVGEFLEYLAHFREARGSIVLQSQEQDAVRLMMTPASWLSASKN